MMSKIRRMPQNNFGRHSKKHLLNISQKSNKRGEFRQKRNPEINHKIAELNFNSYFYSFRCRCKL